MENVTFSPASLENSQSMELSLQLALKERDSSLRDRARFEKEKEEMEEKMELLRQERDRAIENLNGELAEKKSLQ